MRNHPDLYDAILRGDRAAAQVLTQTAMDSGGDPLLLVDGTMIPALHELGDRFSAKKIGLPDLLVGARAMQAGVDLLEPLILKDRRAPRARVCIGTVKGDQHDLGKRVISIVLRAAGYEVDDLGSDCDVDQFDRAVAAGARAVLCSVLITRRTSYLQTITDHFSGRNVHVMIGGAAVTEALAGKIGAAYAADAVAAVRVLDELLVVGS
jgi:5-methyltetrahydrofolate--homocysteine methyltransferase